MMIKNAGLICHAPLLLWFTLDLVGVPGLVTRDPLFGLVGLLELILLLVLVGYWLRWRYSPLFALATLVIWGYMQYESHWRYSIFGASEQKLTRYYKMFDGMHRSFPESHTRLVPDDYHIVLGLLIAINTAAAIVLAVQLLLRSRVPNGPQALYPLRIDDQTTGRTAS